MNPEDVSPKNFTPSNILFDNGSFSIAYGKWENSTMRLAMRWNGTDTDPGYPKLFGNPVWFLIDDSLILPIVKALIGIDDSKKEEIFKVLNVLIK